MASTYDFTGTGAGWIATFDASAAEGMETVKSTDVTTGQFFFIKRIDVACCATTGFRLLDNSVDANRIVSLPAADNSGDIATGSWDFGTNHLEIQYSDYTRLIVESTIAGQIRGTIQGYTGSL